MFVKDGNNNVGRGCAVMGTGEGRVWQVMRAMAGDRYLLRNVNSGEHRAVASHQMTNLY
jgi:hypothetical protein